MSRTRTWMLRLVGVGIFLIIWEIGGRILGDALFAPLSSVIKTYPEMVQEYNLLHELSISMRQLLIGYFLGCTVGVSVGTAMGRSPLIDGLLQPWVSMLFATSIAALVPLFILLFGFDLLFRVAIVFMSTVWYVLLNTYHGARGVDRQLLETARAFDATPLQTFRLVLLPALYPYILAGMRNGLAHAIRATVIVEMYIIVGFGGVVFHAGLEVETAPLIGALLTIMVVGVLLTEVLKGLGRLIAPWYERTQRA